LASLSRRFKEVSSLLRSAYYVAESAYLVPADSPIQSIAEVDRPGVRVAARIGSTQALHLSTSLKYATLLLPGTVKEHVEMLRSSKADVIASARPVLLSFAANDLPGSRILDGSFDSLSVVIAVPKGRLAALAYANDFIETAKATGIVLRAFENAGVKDLTVAPARAR
jgi:polar amino acid transport system substrate-binding protein